MGRLSEENKKELLQGAWASCVLGALFGLPWLLGIKIVACVLNTGGVPIWRLLEIMILACAFGSVIGTIIMLAKESDNY